MNPNRENSSEPVDKGKGRAQLLTERTPLLDFNGASQSFSYTGSEPINPVARRRLRTRLTFVFLTSLLCCVLAFSFAGLLAWSYASRVSKMSPDDIFANSLVIRGPNRVDVLNVTVDGEILVHIDVKLGLDAGYVIGVNEDPSYDGFLGSLWKSIGRWGVRHLDRVLVDSTTIGMTSADDSLVTLGSMDISPVILPLTTNPPSDASWLTDVSISLAVRPTLDTPALIQFLRGAWQNGSIGVWANVGRLIVRGGSLHENDWRHKLHYELHHIRTLLHVQIPPLPGLPLPGHNIPFPSIADLITLKSFSITTDLDCLALSACATLIDPAPPTFNLTSPSMPFIISLPSISNTSSLESIPVASVSTAPFTLTHPNITLLISGTVLPLPDDATTTLSFFLTQYLSSRSNPILISSPLIPGLSVETLFPAPHPQPHILRNVTIRNMKIKPGSTFLASGTVFARVVLPRGIEVELEVYRVLPDVLIFDGEVPNSSTLPPSVPDPLPERAFGHIRPDDWLNSSSVPVRSEEGEGAAFAVTAKIVDVPLEVLPGRQKEFSNFVSKVIFGTEGALAGILGSAAVAVHIDGLPFESPSNGGEMELSGLPFQGSVRVGKKSLLSIAHVV